MLKIKLIGSELSGWFKQVFLFKNSWMLLPGLLAVLLVYGVHHFNWNAWLTSRDFNESFAPWLVLLIFLLLFTRALMSRDPLMIFLTVLALVFLVRELNSTVFSLFGGEYLFKSKKLVDCLLVIMGFWAFGWHERIFASLNRSKMLKVLIAGVAWTYLLSQLIARRAFRGVLPEEKLLHIPLEETVESSAHIFFFVCAVSCFFLVSSRKADQVQTLSHEAEPARDRLYAETCEH